MMFTRTARLFLRPPFPEDGQDYASAMTGAGLLHRVKPMDGASFPVTAGRTPRDLGDARHPRFAITLPSTAGAPLIGVAALLRCAHEVELVCGILPEARGRGFATEAVRALLEIARMIGHRTLVAVPFGGDPASGRVLEKAGFAPASGDSVYHIVLDGHRTAGFVPAAA